MLRLWIGRSGSGKSHAVWEELAALAHQGRDDLYLLVPEQYSFESERNVLEQLGTADAARVQVLSFTRLADRVFREVGGMAGERLDDGMRTLLMSRALEQALDTAEDLGQPLLGIARRQTADASYVQQLLSLWQEMKQCSVSTDQLEQAETTLRQDLPGAAVLPDKVRDLYRVFSVYEGLVASVGLDDWDQLARLAERLPDSRMPDGAVVFVDGFKGFTAQELAVLERLMPRVETLTVTLTSDTPGAHCPTGGVSHAREFPLFSPVTYTVRQLQQTASRHGMSFAVTLFEENRRTADKALQTLEKALYAPVPPVFEEATDSVTVAECFDVYEECQWTARTIRRLLRQEGMRCRSVTVVMRNPADYRGILDDALEQEGIPFYADERQDLLSEPLIAYIRSVLRIAVGGFKTEELLRLLKTDLGPLDVEETARLENYLYTWRIDGAALTRDFTENPEGIGVPVTPKSARQLAELNDLRRRCIEPLMTLRHQMRQHLTGATFALSVYRFLTADERLAQRIAEGAALLEQQHQTVLAEHASRLWDAVIGILDRFAAVWGDAPLTLARAEELFLLLAQQVDLGNVPPSLDAVTVGAADRIRYDEPQVVFILGANEGIFPAYPVSDGLISEEDRRTMRQYGVVLAQDILRQCVEERYYVYTAACAPTRQLFISYQTKGSAVPSALVATVDRCLPTHRRQSGKPAVSELESMPAVFRAFCDGYATSDATRESLRRVLGEDPFWDARAQAVQSRADKTAFRLKDPAVARATFGDDLYLSASQTDMFYRCHFLYFCRYGLHVEPRRVAQVDAAGFGTIVHYVMEKLLPEYTREGGPVDTMRDTVSAAREQGPEELARVENQIQQELCPRLKADVSRTVSDYVRQEMGGMEEKSGRFRYQLRLAERSAYNMLWHTLMELRQSQFRPVDFELAILPQKGDEDHPANSILSVKIPFADGQIQLKGKVDRVDLYIRFDGQAFVRVVDYKTGSKVFDLNEVDAGLNMQMLLYLFILCENSRRYLTETGQLRPAGVLYHPLSDLTVEKGSADGQKKRLSSMRMSGLVLDDPGVIQAMEQEAQKVFIPAGLKKTGEVTGSCITESQFFLLRDLVSRRLTAMAADLLAGDIEAYPLMIGDKTLPCEYCDYRAVCGREPDDPVREKPKRSMEEILEELDGGEGDGDARA